jgi:hypothetical protein
VTWLLLGDGVPYWKDRTQPSTMPGPRRCRRTKETQEKVVAAS